MALITCSIEAPPFTPSNAMTVSMLLVEAIGFDSLDFSFHRSDNASLVFTDGEREGWMTVSTLGTSYEFSHSDFHFSGYTRLDYSFACLNACTESGAGIFNLVYEQRDVESLTSALGVSARLTNFKLWDVEVASLGRVEWVHEFADGNIEYIQYADWLTGPVNQLGANGLRRDYIEAQLGVDLSLGDDWTASADLQGRTNSIEWIGSARIEITKAF